MTQVNRVLFAAILIIFIVSSAYPANVKNESAMQEGNRIMFRFDVSGDDEEVDVKITLIINGKAYSAKDLHLEGDFGKVKIGKGKKIYWNVLEDFPRGYAGDMDFEIIALGGPVADMVYVKGGCFSMGCGTLIKCDSDERPVHEVCVGDFYIETYEVTQKAYRAVNGDNPSHFKGDDNPVDNVTWFEAKDYCEKLKKRLPTEAEWEYAARNGGMERWAGTDIENKVEEYAWYVDNAGDKTHPAGQKKPNGLGLYDMTGNVWEWVSDWYHENYYRKSPKDDPAGPGKDWSDIKGRVLRGGSWFDDAWFTRATNRRRSRPGNRDDNVGFRCAKTP